MYDTDNVDGPDADLEWQGASPAISSELHLDLGTDSGAIDDLEFCTVSDDD